MLTDQTVNPKVKLVKFTREDNGDWKKDTDVEVSYDPER